MNIFFSITSNASACLRTTIISATASAAIILLSSATQAAAADTIKVNPSASYVESVGTPSVRECDWNTKLISYIARYMRGRLEITDEDLTNVAGKTLTVEITKVHAVDGGGFSGPKWAYARSTLRENGVVIGTIEYGRVATNGGSFTTCNVLNNLGKSIAKNTAKWLRKESLRANEKNVDDATSTQDDNSDADKNPPDTPNDPPR